jgi:hypothetical protein
MSRFQCQCGHVISTIAYPNSIEGRIYGIEAEEEFESQVGDAVAAYFAAKKKEERTQWLVAFFSKEYPQDISDSEVIVDIARKTARPYFRDLLECPSCGRLPVEEFPGENRYRSYRSESDRPAGILKLKKQPNQMPEPTPPSVTPAAGQPSRRP